VVLRARLESLGPAAPHADQLVFAAPGGGPLDYSHWRHRVWLPAAAAAGVPGAGFHDLRRANATALVAAGVDIKTAQTRLGHSDPRLTLTIYARAVPEADRAAAELLGARFFMPSSPASPVLPGLDRMVAVCAKGRSVSTRNRPAGPMHGWRAGH
jgi:integrase